MEKNKKKVIKPIWNFDNTYVQLNKGLFSRLNPIEVKTPSLFLFNDQLAKEVDLDFSNYTRAELADLFSGNRLPEGAEPIAQAYAGHQFGHFTMLGDGRAILLGEHIDQNNTRWDIQLKGSGRTPYSRGGDGRATLKSMLREYLISEAIHYLGISSSRSLAVTLSGETVQREEVHKAAILTRLAKSHIRVGTIEYIRNFMPQKELQSFCNYVINRHYPDLINTPNPPLELLKTIQAKQINLVIEWMRVGFIHGVMNTDNTSLVAETIDYGPCAFMNTYHPQTVFSSIDRNGRYAFGNQARVIHWNMAALAGALIPIIHQNENKAVELVKEVLNTFPSLYQQSFIQMMRKKLGLSNKDDTDHLLIQSLLNWMQKKEADYTNTFNYLIDNNFMDDIYEDEEFKEWKLKWERRVKNENNSHQLMTNSNPKVIPRNHIVEDVLDKAAFEDDIKPLLNFLEILKQPYAEISTDSLYSRPPIDGDKSYQTFCGT